MKRAVLVTFGSNHLRHDVDSGGDEVAHDMAVVGAHILTLRRGDIHPRTRRKEELVDVNIGGDLVPTLIPQPGHFRIAGEQPVVDGFQKTPFQIASRFGSLKRQGGHDRQLQAGIGLRALIETVDQGDGFAQTQRSRQHDPTTHAGERVVYQNICISESCRTHC